MARPRKNRTAEEINPYGRKIELEVQEEEITLPKEETPIVTPVEPPVEKYAAEVNTGSEREHVKEKTFTASEVAEMVKKAAAEAAAEAVKNAGQQTQVIHVTGEQEKVVLRWFAPVSDGNLAVFGERGQYGTATGKFGTVIVPKSEWSRFYDESNKWFIDNRWLIVLSGLTDSERKLYNCDYKSGELMDVEAFRGVVSMGKDLVPIFDGLCTEHQEMVALAFIDHMEKSKIGDEARGYIKELNAINKARYKDLPDGDVRKKGMFAPVIAAMNAADEE